MSDYLCDNCGRSSYGLKLHEGQMLCSDCVTDLDIEEEDEVCLFCGEENHCERNCPKTK